MNTVRCPVCDQRLIGGDCEDLTSNLREHLEKEHNIQELCNAATGGMPPSTVARSYEPPGGEAQVSRAPTEEERERLRMGNRLREAELRREQESWSPPAGSDVPPRTHGVGGWVRRTLGLGNADRPDVGADEEWRQGQGYPDMAGARRRRPAEGSIIREEHERERGRDPVTERQPVGPSSGAAGADYVDCPMCGQHLSGADEDELSLALREHMASVHEVAPLLTTRPRP